MLELMRPLLARTVSVIAPRATAVMLGGGLLTGFGSQVIDLRGQLPVSETRHYGQRQLSAVQGLVWHHSATAGATIHSIAEYHVEVKKWPAIAYHYAIGWDGVVYVLNDATTISYQAQGYNSHTIGVVLIGNYEEHEMSDAMKASAARLEDHLADKYGLQYVWLHRDTKATLCPGKYAAAWLRGLTYGRKP